MKDFHIGKMRWRVALCTQQQLNDPNSPAVTTEYVRVAYVHAAIEPVTTTQFLLGVQTDFLKITHEIILRATGDYLDRFTYIIRDRIRPDLSKKQEIFRIHRMLEVEGRQRFIKCDAELISSGNVINQDH